MKVTKAYRPGENYFTNHGSLVIKSNSDRMNFRWIKFLNTGFEREARVDHIKNGKVADPFHITVCGVGYLGEGVHKTKVQLHNGKWAPYKVYTLWAAMLTRYYKSNDPAYKDATVHPDWHNYQTFANDLPLLVGFAEWCKLDSDYQLDKDKLGNGSKIYSKTTCCLIPHLENQKLKVAYNGCIKPTKGESL